MGGDIEEFICDCIVKKYLKWIIFFFFIKDFKGIDVVIKIVRDFKLEIYLVNIEDVLQNFKVFKKVYEVFLKIILKGVVNDKVFIYSFMYLVLEIVSGKGLVD